MVEQNGGSCVSSNMRMRCRALNRFKEWKPETNEILTDYHWQINKMKEKKELSFSLLWHDTKFTEMTAESSFLYFAKAWQFWMSCFYLYTAIAWRAHRQHIFAILQPVQSVAFSVNTMLICEGWWSMQMKHRAYFINNNILTSRYVSNMKTFRFVPIDRGRHQFNLKLINFWLHIYIA